MLEKIICNNCGREIQEKNGISREDYLYIRKEWGYFSEKDGKIHEFILCEKCYDDIIGDFQKPIKITEVTEFM